MSSEPEPVPVNWTREQAVEVVFASIREDWLPMMQRGQSLPDYENKRFIDICGVELVENWIKDKSLTRAEAEEVIEVCNFSSKRAVIREWREDLYEETGDGLARAWLWNNEGLQDISLELFRKIDEEGSQHPYSFYTFTLKDDLIHVHITHGPLRGGRIGRDYLIRAGAEGRLELIDDPEGKVFHGSNYRE